MANVIRTQIEVRYSNMLTFSEIYRRIVAPYAKLGRVEVNNPGTLEEYIVVSIPDENILMDVRWDRMLFLCDGKPDNLYSSNGPMIYFFRILEQFQKEDTFGKIKALLIAKWTLTTYDKNEKEVLDEFRSKYFNNNLPSISGLRQNDLGVQLILEDNSSNLKLHFGPFKQDDIQNFQLAPLWTKEISSLLSQKGILCMATFIEKTTTANIDVLKKMDRKITEVIEQIKI